MEFGPYRVLPPGTAFIDRDYGPAPAPTDFVDTSDASAIEQWSAYVAPPNGVSQQSLSARTLKGVPLQVFATWSQNGARIDVVVTDYPDAMLPIDVYLHPSDSPIAVRTETLAGKPAVIEEPAAKPAAGVGYVAIWLGDVELALRSPDVGQDVLREIASQVARSR